MRSKKTREKMADSQITPQGVKLTTTPRRSVENQGASQREGPDKIKPWTNTQKEVLEIICGILLYTSDEADLTIERIAKRARLMFKNMQMLAEGQNWNLPLRLRNMVTRSPFFNVVEHKTSAGSSRFELNSSKVAEFKEHVKTFIEKKSELAEEHGILKLSEYPRPKRTRDRVSTPKANKSDFVAPKKRRDYSPSMPVDKFPPTALLDPVGEAASADDETENLDVDSALETKKSFAFSHELQSTIANSEDGSQKLLLLSTVQDWMNRAATIPVAKKAYNDLKAAMAKDEHAMEEVGNELVSQLVERMREKQEEILRKIIMEILPKQQKSPVVEGVSVATNTEAVQVVTVTTSTDVIECVSVATTTDVVKGVSIATNTLEHPDDKYAGQLIVDEHTNEKYEVVKHLGDGSFGKVLKARDSKNNLCAIKVTMETEADDNSSDELKFIAAIKDAMEQGDQPPPYLAVSEHFRAVALGQMRKCERMDVYDLSVYDAIFVHDVIFSCGQALRVVGQICSALAWMHAKAFIHSDIKPDNIMFDNAQFTSGKFGRFDARLIDHNVVVHKEGPYINFAGQSVPYRAPEMCLGLPCDGNIDVFALGLVALQMLTGPDGFFLIMDADVEIFDDPDDVNAAILGEIERLIGPIPPALSKKSKVKRFSSGVPFKKIIDDNAPKKTMKQVCDEVTGQPCGKGAAQYISKMLKVDPKNRPTANMLQMWLAKLIKN